MLDYRGFNGFRFNTVRTDGLLCQGLRYGTDADLGYRELVAKKTNLQAE